MIEYVTITTQGQITIPAKFRKILGLKTSTKASVKLVKDKMIIRPAKDLMELDSIIHEKKLKYTPDKIRKIEKKAWKDSVKD